MRIKNIHPIEIGIAAISAAVAIFLLTKKRFGEKKAQYESEYADFHQNFKDRFYGKEEDGIELFSLR